MATHTKLAIIGSGPAGYSAATYAARAQLAPLLFAGEKSGGQLMLTTEVENYAGFSEGIMGPDLMMSMRAQAERFGTTMVDAYVSAVDFSQRPFRLWTQQPSGKLGVEELGLRGTDEQMKAALDEIKSQKPTYTADAVIVATGAVATLLGIPGESEYMGKGVSVCAVCDAAFFRDKRVFVVGGGDAAMEDTLALTKFAASINLVHRRDVLRASKIMQDRVLEDNADRVSVWWNTEVVEVRGDGQKITHLVLKHLETGDDEMIEADGLFIAIGHAPMTAFLRGELELEDKGYVVTRFGLGSPSVKLAADNLTSAGMVAYPTMTSVEGVFAAGDNVDFRYRQAITAAGYGCMAALDAEWWLERGAE